MLSVLKAKLYAQSIYLNTYLSARTWRQTQRARQRMVCQVCQWYSRSKEKKLWNVTVFTATPYLNNANIPNCKHNRNVRSLINNKLRYYLTYYNNYDFSILTETRLNAGVLDFNNYNIFRCDKICLTSNCNRRDGVLIGTYL